MAAPFKIIILILISSNILDYCYMINNNIKTYLKTDKCVKQVFIWQPLHYLNITKMIDC